MQPIDEGAAKRAARTRSRDGDSDLLRALGFGEARMHLMQTLLHGTTQGATVVRLEGNLDMSALEAAMTRARRTYGVLQVDIVERGSSLFFRRRPARSPLPLTVLCRRSDTHWIELVEQENSRPLDVSQGLWRAFVLQPYRRDRAAGSTGPRCEIVFLAHHSILDGAAAALLLRRILDDAVRPGGRWARRPLPPPAEAVCSSGQTWESFQAKQAAFGRALAAVDPMPYAVDAPIAERMTRVIPLSFSGRCMMALIQRSNAAGVTIYSQLSALLLVAVQENSPTRSRFALHTAVSLRSVCERAGALKADDLGCYLTVVGTVHAVHGETVTALAREHRDAVYDAVLRYGRTPAHVDVGALRTSITAAAQKGHFAQDIGITYLEVPAGEPLGDVRVTEHYITANRAAGSAALIVHAVRRGDELFVTVNYTAPLQRETWAYAVAATFRRIVEEWTAVGSQDVDGGAARAGCPHR